MARFRTDAITFNTTAGNKTVAITPAVGELIVAIAGNSGTTTDPTVTDDRGGTYTRIGGATKNVSADEMHFYVRDRPCQLAVSHTLTMNVGGAGTGGGIWAAAIPDMSKAGLNAVRQIATQDNQAAGGTPTGTFARPTLAESMVIFAVLNGATTATITEPAGFAERRDTGYNNPATGIEIATDDAIGSAVTSVAAQSTSGSAFCTIVVELDVATETFAQSGRSEFPGQPHELRLRRLPASPRGVQVPPNPLIPQTVILS